jgi:deazaflavin-dependent oxidoreductase (nitroreductase family)
MSNGADFHQFNQQVIEQFRASGGHGKLGPVTFENLLLLTTKGRRSGQPRTVPLGSVCDEDGNYVLFASNMGAPADPDWYRNIAADPHVTVVVTDDSFEADAIVASGARRDAAYRLWIEHAPHVADHQEKAGREIPMVLVRRPSG